MSNWVTDVNCPEGIVYAVKNGGTFQGLSRTTYDTSEYVARTLENALAGDHDAYLTLKFLVKDNYGYARYGEYTETLEAIRQTYGYE